MTRARPTATDLPTFGPTFDAMCAAAAIHWRTTLPQADEDAPVVLVDLLMQDLRLALRTLTLANSVRRMQAARLVVLVGPNRHWHDGIWDGYDRERWLQLARAYGADDVIDVAGLTGLLEAGSPTVELLGGRFPAAPSQDETALRRLRTLSDSTAVRVLRVPRLRDASPEDDVLGIERSVALEDRLYRTIFDSLPVRAFVTSHVDYGQWGLAVEAATRSGVPVVHAQATGGLKAYALFAGSEGAELGFRRALTLQIQQQFEDQVWRHRDVLAAGAERTAWRSKANLGRPSWWRGGGEISRLDLRSTAERAALRGEALRRLGLDTDKPVVTVFAHAVSDAVQGNHEAFDDLASWLERTADFAAATPEVSWLFLDHPSQVNYDRTEHFEHLAGRHADHRHIVFRPSLSLSRNSLWSITDLAVTVRGSVSAEFPAYGIPALQAGWSEWSHLGFSRRADTEDQYYDELRTCVRALCAGERLLTAEQVRRARLWLWLYRSGADVTTPLVPHWENGQGTALHQLVTTAMNHVEDDADPAYVSVRRLWERREAVLTRMDLGLESCELADQHALAADPGRPRETVGLETAHEDWAPRAAGRVSSGRDFPLRMVEGFVRGEAIVGRASHPEAILVLDTGAHEGSGHLEIEFAVDSESASWWDRRSAESMSESSGRRRRLSVALPGSPETVVELPHTPPPGGAMSTARVALKLPAPSGRLVPLVIRSHQGNTREFLPQSIIGLRVNFMRMSTGQAGQ
ncbi:hypothetical protein [Terrabacter sp. BE26]|uniref:hypothetical protein n=1 Tax=Terrabacter sp. BE26 TaxID=2898152 RepID=UPI0035BE7DC0